MRWAQRFRRCCATSTASAATASYCGDNDAQIDHINVFYHGTSGDKYVPRALLLGFEPGVIDDVRASPLG
jgi:hypothetical protein